MSRRDLTALFEPRSVLLVGATGDIGKMLGLDNRWALNIVKQVGNYAESFDANLKPLGFERGLGLCAGTGRGCLGGSLHVGE